MGVEVAGGTNVAMSVGTCAGPGSCSVLLAALLPHTVGGT